MTLRTLIILGILVPGIVAAAFNRFAALVLYLWFAIFRPQEWLWTDISALRLSFALGGLVIVPSILSGILPDLTHPLTAGSLLFLVTTLPAQLNAIDPDVGWQWIGYLTRLIAICLFVAPLVTTKRRFFLALAVVAGSFGFYSAKAGVAFLLGGGVQFALGVAGAFPDNEGYAIGTIMILPLLIATAQNAKRRLIRWGFWAAVPLSVLTIIGTFSRGGFVGLVAAVLVFIALQRRRVVAFATVAVAAAAVLTVVPIPSRYFDRLETIRTYRDIEETSALSRFHFWKVAFDMTADHPLGIGLHNYEATYDRYDSTNGAFGRRRAVHNSTLEVLAETGFAGAAIWVALFAFAFMRCWRVRARSRSSLLGEDDRRFLWTSANALITSMVGFLVAGSFLAIALNDLTWLTFAFVAALDRLSLRMVPAAAPAMAGVKGPVAARFSVASGERV